MTVRGVERRPIFLDDRHRELYLALLGASVHEFGWECHAHVLMDNHAHFLLGTPEANLSRGMQRLNGRYAQAFNQLTERTGHLFQGRFKQVVIRREAHLLAVIRYIVLNPVRAGVCAAAEDHAWSSYRATAGLAPVPSFLEVAWTLAQFHPTSRREAQARYRDYVAAGVGAASLHGILLPEAAMAGV